MNLSPLHQVSLGHINRILYIYLALAVVAMAFSFPELVDASGGGDGGQAKLNVYALPTMGLLLVCSFLMMQEKDSRRERPLTIFYGWFVPTLFAAAALYELLFIILHANPDGALDWSWPVVHGLLLLACLHLCVSCALFDRLQRQLRRELKEVTRKKLQKESPPTRFVRGEGEELPVSKREIPSKAAPSALTSSREAGAASALAEEPPTRGERAVPYASPTAPGERFNRRVRRFPRLCLLMDVGAEGDLRTRLEEGCVEMLRRSPWGNFARRGSDGRREEGSGVPREDLRLMAQAITGYILHERPSRPTLSRPCYMVGSVFEVEDFASLLSENLAEEVTSLYVRRDGSLREAALVSLLFRYRWCAESDKFFDPELLARMIQEMGDAEERDEYRRKLLEALQEMRAC